MRSPLNYEDPACRGTDTDAYFPGVAYSRENHVAKKICTTCPHLDECFQWGIHHEEHGIWGGLTPNERRDYRRQRNIIISSPHLAFLPSVGAA